MKHASTLKAVLTPAVALVALALSSLSTFAADEFSFVVKNKTESRITKILVSENGRSYSPFDIGRGIKPGEKVTLVWDKSTNSESCKQWVKAVYADGSEAKAAKFDFCEEDLEIEFEE